MKNLVVILDWISFANMLILLTFWIFNGVAATSNGWALFTIGFIVIKAILKSIYTFRILKNQ